MSGSTVRWLRRIGIGAAVLLVAGFALGSLAAPKDSASRSGARNTLAYDSANFGLAARGVSLKIEREFGFGKRAAPEPFSRARLDLRTQPSSERSRTRRSRIR